MAKSHRLFFQNKDVKEKRDENFIASAFFELFSKKKRPTSNQISIFVREYHQKELDERENKKFIDWLNNCKH